MTLRIDHLTKCIYIENGVAVATINGTGPDAQRLARLFAAAEDLHDLCKALLHDNRDVVLRGAAQELLTRIEAKP